MVDLFRDQDRYHLIENKCDQPCIIDDESKNLMSRVFDYYRSYNPYELIDLTHEKGSAWNRGYHGKNKNGIIPNSSIKKEFKIKWLLVDETNQKPKKENTLLASMLLQTFPLLNELL